MNLIIFRLDLLDFFILRKNSPNYTQVEDNLHMNSDHSGAFLTLSDVIKKSKSYSNKSENNLGRFSKHYSTDHNTKNEK